MKPMQIHEIGGGVVVKPFNSPAVAAQLGQDSPYIRAGTHLPEGVLASMNLVNRNNMISREQIRVWPKAAVVSPPGASTERGQPQRHLVTLGFGRFDVIEGHKLNKKALSKDEALKLIGDQAAAEKPKTNGKTRKRRGH